ACRRYGRWRSAGSATRLRLAHDSARRARAGVSTSRRRPARGSRRRSGEEDRGSGERTRATQVTAAPKSPPTPNFGATPRSVPTPNRHGTTMIGKIMDLFRRACATDGLLASTHMEKKTTRRGNYESGSDYVLEYGELRFAFNEEDFGQRVE